MTGRTREIEIWFAADGDRLFLLSGGRDAAHWVRNLVAEPRVTVRIAGRTFEGRARVIAETDADDAAARAALAAKYGRKWLERWLRESLPVEIRLERERSA